jgi:hypothetical protein
MHQPPFTNSIWPAATTCCMSSRSSDDAASHQRWKKACSTNMNLRSTFCASDMSTVSISRFTFVNWIELLLPVAYWSTAAEGRYELGSEGDGFSKLPVVAPRLRPVDSRTRS